MAQTLPFYIREDDPPAKRQILRAAMKLFSERGLAGSSIRDIAKESGYTNPALYKHFAGKDELALYLFEICHRRLWTKCNAAINAAKSFDDKLEGTSARSSSSWTSIPRPWRFCPTARASSGQRRGRWSGGRR